MPLLAERFGEDPRKCLLICSFLWPFLPPPEPFEGKLLAMILRFLLFAEDLRTVLQDRAMTRQSRELGLCLPVRAVASEEQVFCLLH
jgi:hypothetical protein